MESASSIAGSLFAGFIYMKYNQELVSGLAGLLYVLIMGISPWTGHVIAFIVCLGLIGGFLKGFIDAGR